MKFCILGSPENWYVRDLMRAAQGHSIDVCSFEDVEGFYESQAGWKALANGYPLHQCDAIFVRTMPLGSLEQMVIRLDMLHVLQQQDVISINPPRTLEIAIDKWLTLHHLRRAGHAIPATAVCQRRQQAMEAFERLGGDVVVKPIFGGEGRGIMRVQDADLAWRVFSALEQLRQVAYLQEFVPHFGYDIRLLAVGSKIAAVRRESKEDWRTNVSRGAVAVPIEPTAEQVQTVQRVMHQMQATTLGIDLLPACNGETYLLEVNAVPGWKGTASATGIDVAGWMIDAAVEQVEKSRDSRKSPAT